MRKLVTLCIGLSVVIWSCNNPDSDGVSGGKKEVKEANGVEKYTVVHLTLAKVKT